MYYFDNAATTRPHPDVIAAMHQVLLHDFANPSSVHPPGIKAARHVEHARKRVADYFKVPLQGVIFCGSGTESDNLAIKGAFKTRDWKQSNLITTKLEHAAVLKAAQSLGELGVEIRFVRIVQETGLIDLNHLNDLLDDQTRLVSIQHVNSETGTIQDLQSISKVIQEKAPLALFHSDGVQAFSKFPVDLQELGVDLYSISSHKLHGTKGVGALIRGRKASLLPLLHGGGQEFGLRSGTENVPGIVAFDKAIEIALKTMEERTQKVREFSAWLVRKIETRFPEIQIYQQGPRIPHILSLSLPQFPGEVLLHHLADAGIYVSTGSACNATSKRLSSSLQAFGYTPQRIRGTIRISMAALELPVDRNAFFQRFEEVVAELHSFMS